ncbi:MAG TPA: hypothetical protein DCP53_04310 [Elusimicrobia bacterium]|nr:MAG: hypothetical protein A2551_07475 [Elusimicrobia bacterium RIFOXYD2_FULL_34_30]HAM38604.1 hypothetical protein [Elusimicrobiota bacterium]
MIIAVAGKGGVGKSTITALIIKHLIKRGQTPVLAVDADPNANLGYYLGVECDVSISDLREDEFKNNPTGISKVDWLDLKTQECIIETNSGFDILVMGKPEGPGCYCAVNNLLRTFIKKIGQQYKFVVIDNEAGLEHISRRTNEEVDVLFIVAEPTKISLIAAENVKKTAEALGSKIKNKYLLINKKGIDKEKEPSNNMNISGLETIGYVRYNNFSSNFDNNILNNKYMEIEKDIEGILNKAEVL